MRAVAICPGLVEAAGLGVEQLGCGEIRQADNAPSSYENLAVGKHRGGVVEAAGGHVDGLAEDPRMGIEKLRRRLAGDLLHRVRVGAVRTAGDEDAAILKQGGRCGAAARLSCRRRR